MRKNIKIIKREFFFNLRGSFLCFYDLRKNQLFTERDNTADLDKGGEIDIKAKSPCIR